MIWSVGLLVGISNGLYCTPQGGRTALLMASYNGHDDVVKTLLAAGAAIEAVDNVSSVVE